MMKRQVKTKIATTERYNPRLTSWTKIKKSILKIEADAFPQYEPQANILETDFTNKNNIVILLRSIRGSIIGYTYAEPVGQLNPRRKKNRDTAYITSIAIHPRFQGKGLVVDLHKLLDKILVKKGYSFVEGHVVNKNYARSLQKMYADKIVQEKMTWDENERKRFVRIRLD
ncbi:GNAT family N-acetyltransferase [Candidatus Gottesmanbacteria bacterium]|nr:GNAT family N-acetyltransferase [Candidatus Gottesmanbacteria bacterium]